MIEFLCGLAKTSNTEDECITEVIVTLKIFNTAAAKFLMKMIDAVLLAPECSLCGSAEASEGGPHP